MFEAAVQALQRGEVIAVPTEAVFGLSVDPRNLEAVARLLELKHRNPAKGLILVGSEVSQLEPYVELIPPSILSSWPGPHTWVCPAKAAVSSLIKGKHESLAIRVTAHPVMSALCHAFGGALISTSANTEGQPPAMNHEEVRAYFGNELVIVPGDLGGLDKPTAIRDALTGTLIR